MPTNYPSFFLTKPIAQDSEDKTLPPVTAEDAGNGRLSQSQGWGPVNSLPATQGGIPPNRFDFNGILFVITKLLFWWQMGGLMRWRAGVTYEPGCEVFHNGTKYRCLQQCTNIVPPNRSYWKDLDKSSVRAGMVISAYNVTVDASGHPIWWGETDADTGFLLCDGRSDGLGGNVPNMIDRMIRGSTPSNSGQTGGSDSVTLSVAQMPQHSHGASVSTNGNHTHDRGSMNITGYFRATVQGGGSVSGAFSQTTVGDGDQGYEGGEYKQISLNAASSWSGNTSQNGSHSHTVTIGNSGSGSAVDIKNPFFKMAFFIKLPD